MNKILSQALKKAVSEYSPEVKQISKDNRPDLFSLNNETELFQNDRGIIIKIATINDSKSKGLKSFSIFLISLIRIFKNLLIPN